MSVKEAWFRVMLKLLEGYRNFIHSPFDPKATTTTTPQAPGVPTNSPATALTAANVTTTSTPAASVPATGGSVGTSVSAQSSVKKMNSITSAASTSTVQTPVLDDDVGARGAMGWYDSGGFVAVPKSRRMKAFRAKLVTTQSWQAYVDACRHTHVTSSIVIPLCEQRPLLHSVDGCVDSWTDAPCPETETFLLGVCRAQVRRGRLFRWSPGEGPDIL